MDNLEALRIVLEEGPWGWGFEILDFLLNIWRIPLHCEDCARVGLSISTCGFFLFIALCKGSSLEEAQFRSFAMQKGP